MLVSQLIDDISEHSLQRITVTGVRALRLDAFVPGSICHYWVCPRWLSFLIFRSPHTCSRLITLHFGPETSEELLKREHYLGNVLATRERAEGMPLQFSWILLQLHLCGLCYASTTETFIE